MPSYVGAPTYEATLFPPVAQVIDMAALKRIVGKRTAIFGSYGWSRGAVETFKRLVEPLKWDVTDVLEFNGGPTKDLLARAGEFGERFAAAVKAEPQA